jgi:uncharacterized membrane protein/YHS domain-containing protein
LIRTLSLMVIAFALLALVGPALAAEAAESAEAAGKSAEAAASSYDPNAKTWPAFFGRLHMVVLHLPIGLLIGAFAIEVFGLFRRSKGYDVAAAWLFVLGFGASIIAVVSGLLLATEEAAKSSAAGQGLTALTILFADADQGVSDTLNKHMWLGVGLMLVAGVAAILKILAVKKQWPDDVDVPDRGGLPLAAARVALVAMMVLMPLAGHIGGNLVHGREFLTERAPNDTVRKLVEVMNLDGAADVAEKPKPGEGGDVAVVKAKGDWDSVIQPALDDHCVACHGPDKQNGELRLDTLEWAVKGGSLGGTIEPGNAEFSELYRRVILPPSHDEFMPTNIKKYGMLNLEEIHALGEWILAFDGNLEAAPADDDTAQASGGDEDPEPAKPLIDPAAIRAIEDAGGSAQSLSQEEDPDLLDVKFAYLKTLNPEAVAKIGNTAGQVAWLDLQGSSFGDEAAQQLPAMPKLTKLNLKDTAITDEGVAALPDLPKLRWLNLFGTEITDTSLEAIADYTELEKLYITGTNVSAQGVAKLREALPDTEVFSDFDAEFDFTQDEPEPASQDKPEGDQTSVKAVNTVCPVSGAPVKPGFVSTYEGKVVGFCCNNCKGKFDAEPAKFAGKLAE